jgi:putative tryptophan/tyrosine transport system substrate-binding protein
MNRLAAITTALLFLAGVVAAANGASSDDARSIAIVTSRDDGPYEGVIAGLRNSLSGRKGSRLQVYSLQGDADHATTALRAARRTGSAPLITIGSSATRAALEAPGDGPVIACMIGDAHDLQNSPNATGVLLEFPIEVQLKWIRRFVPNSQAIGVLYNPAENRERIAEAEKAAERLGLRLVAREIQRPQDLPGALESLAGEADVLLAITDEMVLSPQTAQAILLFSFRNRMAFSGLSASWVKAGALYALERDYQDVGAQCAEMALKVLDGARASSLPPAMPRKVAYALNARTAEHLKLRLAPELIDGAVEVFR